MMGYLLLHELTEADALPTATVTIKTTLDHAIMSGLSKLHVGGSHDHLSSPSHRHT